MVIDRNSQIKTATILGTVFLTVILIIAIAIPYPTDFQYQVIRITLALASGGIAATVPGIFNLKISKFISASGALAVFVTVYFYSPAQLAIKLSGGTYAPARGISELMSKNAQEYFDSKYRGFENGVNTIEEAITAHQKLVAADLILCKTPNEVRVLREGAFKTAQDLENTETELFKIGVSNKTSLIAAQQYRLECEVELSKSVTKP